MKEKFNREQERIYRDIVARCTASHACLSDKAEDGTRYCKLGFPSLPCEYIRRDVEVVIRRMDEKTKSLHISRYPRCMI